ncbi:hypothetical protein AVL48_25060 [Amycolatopsis regifaucium]|uniref:DUF1449 domain-containing protein n=2 Tax=Amycolatopsis regifaucium TaxID=546365 RepID=A0A154MS26_9PSEU|nr:hypothetical protein AVL48_25060 [Amycolatopsis regifaucium]OKA09340.1 hypothetical protein ATP06_0207615 [Amycolatopsis regifaucium]SFH58810.1 hypothetical protein SAMN04489731_105139 [Amycolatopsis regifaucium]
MGGFVTAALGFPAVLFSFLLIVVIGYWLLALLGAVDADGFDVPEGEGLLAGFGGVPLSLSLSLLIAFTWFASLAGTVLLDDLELSTPSRIGFGAVVVAVALVLGTLGTRVIVVPLRRVFGPAREPSRMDFVGRAAVIRTSSVTHDFGQAEVAAADGSTAIVDVRQAGEGNLTAGSRVVLYDYDSEGEFFWVESLDI